MRQASQTTIPDTTSGFRAYNREAALAMQVVSKFTYTLETIIQAGKMTVAVDHVPVRTNPKLRESRLFPSMWTYIRRNGVSIFRIYAMYEPLRVFLTAAMLLGGAAIVVWGRFVYFYLQGHGAGHVQSLILGAVLFNAAIVLAALGVLGDLLSGQRITLQRIFERIRRVELELGVPPSHYEPGAQPTGQPPTTGRAIGRARHDRRARGREAVSGTVTRDAEGTVTGNTYDKYGSNNPVVRRLMAGFERTLAELFRQAAPRSLLDVGCGEGVLTQQWAQRLAGRVVGIDLEDPVIQAEWEKRRAPNLEYRVMKAENLPFADDEFDMACAIEVLEHVPDPEHTVAEMARVASGAPARVGPARAAVARPEHGPRGLPGATSATRPAT